MIKIDISTEEKRNDVLKVFKTFHFIKDAYNYYNICANTANNKYIHDIADKIGFSFDENRKLLEGKKYCLYCGKELDIEKRGKNVKFCNSSCAAKYNNSKRIVSEETKEKISKANKKDNPLNTKITYKRNYTLKERLFRQNLKEYKCEKCGISEWNGEDIVLQLHHINGNRLDNRLENIQILCPNCHSQTENFCNKNRKQYQVRPKFYCKKCGKELYSETKTGLCADCYNEWQRETKSKCPSKKVLEEDLKETTANSALAKKYGVCTSTIKKWLIRYNLYNNI